MTAEPDQDDVERPTRRSRGPSLPAPLGNLLRPFERTGRFYAQSWRDYLAPSDSALPIARPTVALASHAFRDELVLLGLRAQRPLSDPEQFERITGEVVEAIDFYRRKGWLDEPEGFFSAPPRSPTSPSTKSRTAGTHICGWRSTAAMHPIPANLVPSAT